ncbi:hypothetical protein E2562_025492 [Oryza meyeriana var. granulata]|uniref:Uncharacterized protein n=1 Tax=Oryza meyeriana var. granulata TaxID=110450 RepID=A0A6G1CIP1_9ORYZ|nr:hypothetical protein E2562_025492 [Oryza meyeriana var. granulata]
MSDCFVDGISVAYSSAHILLPELHNGGVDAPPAASPDGSHVHTILHRLHCRDHDSVLLSIYVDMHACGMPPAMNADDANAAVKTMVHPSSSSFSSFGRSQARHTAADDE